jgi:tight adherence protein C
MTGPGRLSALGGFAATGALLGLALGAGVALLLLGLPILRRPTLQARLAPYVQDVLPPSRLLDRHLVVTPVPLLRRLVEPVLRRAALRASSLLGAATSVQRRIDRAGLSIDVETFRAEQLLWTAAGAAAGGAVATGAWCAGRGDALALAMLVVLAAAAGFAARDWLLSHQAKHRERQMMAEFPTVAEMLALAVGAGEGPVAALERVASLCRGELSDELRRTMAEARAGASLVQALQGLSARTELAPLARFVDGVVVAVERGTPLAEVLRGQAQDVREAGQRALLESAGRKEIAMMVPVVFGVLPVTVLFAVYPGFAFLRMGL